MSTHSSGSSVGRGPALPPHLVPLGMALTPKNLLKRHKLPVAAHLHAPTAPPGLDLSRPLLLYNTYTSTKVRGVSLRPGKNGDLSPIGPTIVIPDSYTGWFAVVTSDGHTASYYNTVEQVAASQVSFFLTRYDVPAFTNKQDENGGLSYQKTMVQSGHVLKLLGIYEDLNARRTNSGGRGRDMSSLACDKYAQCLNYRNDVVFLPYSATGRFYTTAQKSSKNPNHVYLMTHILKNHRLPITVRLVCGYMPRVPCNFTGVLRLEQAQKEAVILACTMTNEAEATLFEIDVSSNFALAPVKDTMFSKTPIFLKTVSYCEDEAEAWRRQIKVTHHVTEKRSRSLTRSLSDKFVEPLTNVRPLSLSFLSDHDKRKVRERDHSREGRLPPTKDKSRDLRFRDFRRRENSVEKTKFTYHDRSNSLNSYPLKESGLEHKKNSDIRKISKQNTYVLQNGKSSKQVEKKQVESESSSFLSTVSVENMDYSRVADDISPIPEKEEGEGESHYAEICDIALRAGSSTKYEGPLSLPNLSLFQRAGSKKEDKLTRRISSNISSLSNISLRSNGSARKQIRRSTSGTPSETGSHQSSARVSECSSREDSGSIKERNKSERVNKLRRQEVQKEDRLCDASSTVFEKDKDNEVYSQEVSKKEKLKGLLSAEFKRHKESVKESDKWERLKRLSRREVPRDKPGKLPEEENLGTKSASKNAKQSREMLGKDKVNEVYIIRMVVKDKEEDQMSTLARDKSGGYYMKIRGFEVPKDERGRVLDGEDEEISGYDSLC